MKMVNLKYVAYGWLVLTFSIGVSPTLKAADASAAPTAATASADHATSQPPSPAEVRPAPPASTVPAPAKDTHPAAAEKPNLNEYEGYLASLAKISAGGITINVKGLDGKNVPIELSDRKTGDLITAIKTIQAYRKQLVTCADNDKSAELFGNFLDSYVGMLAAKFTDDPQQKSIRLDEKEIITYTAQIQKFLKKKAGLFDKSVADFDKADKELNDQLTGIAKILWNGKYPKEKFPEDKARVEPSAETNVSVSVSTPAGGSVTKTETSVGTAGIVGKMDKAIAELVSRSDQDFKTCTLKPSVTEPKTKVVKKTDGKENDDKTKKVDIKAAPLFKGNDQGATPTPGGASPGGAATNTVDFGGGGGPGGDQPSPPANPPGFEELLRRFGEGQQNLNQVEAAIQRELEEIRRARAEQQALADQNKNNEDGNLAAAIKALSERNDNPTQPPTQLAGLPSGESGGRGAQEQQPIGPQPTDQQDKQPAPAVASQPAPSAPQLVVPPSSSKVSDPAPRPTPIVVKDEATAIKEKLDEVQLQLKDAQIAQLQARQQGPGNNGAMLRQAGNGLASKQRRNAPSSRLGSQSKGKGKKKRASFRTGSKTYDQLGMQPGAAANVVSSRLN